MELTRRSLSVYLLLGALWALVVGWQVQEHMRVREAARTDLRNRSKDIANTLSAFIRGLRFRGSGTVFQDRLEPVLHELVTRTNELVKSSQLTSIVLLNAANEPVAYAGKPLDPAEIVQSGERWGANSVTLVNPIDLGGMLTSEGATNPTVVLEPPPRDWTNNPEGFRGRGFSRREPRPEEAGNDSNRLSEAGSQIRLPKDELAAADPNRPPPPPDREPRRREGEPRPRRPFWLRAMDDQAYQTMIEKRALHGLVLAMSTESVELASRQDLWLRSIIVLLATILAVGSALVWRNLAKVSDLQIRLVRASEVTTHLKEMNLAAAGLAHETRNPLNIIRGLAQMISKQPEAAAEIQNKSREIIGEADKVAAQLNEFINYSRPREVHRAVLPLGTVVNEVVRALNYDLEEKKIRLEVQGEQLSIEADEQLLRQALFNLILNAIQAADGNGEIQVLAERRTASEAVLEVRDNGPGVPAYRRAEIFKPYFTTNKTGTGLGLAVVQQIVLAHGWEIQCLPNEPKGAVFRITHLKVAA